MVTTALLHASLCALLVGEPGEPPPEPRFDRPAEPGPRRVVRAGGGLMASGGTLMVVGAGVLVPLGVVRAAQARQPDPTSYDAVEPFRQDMLSYQRSVQRSMTLGIAGSITAVVGATAFVAGAITWGVGRRRLRRSNVSMMIGPGRRGVVATFGARF